MKFMENVQVYFRPILLSFLILISNILLGQTTIPKWADSDRCLSGRPSLFGDADNLYYKHSDGTVYTLHRNKTISGLNGLRGTWSCDGNTLSISTTSTTTTKTSSASSQSNTQKEDTRVADEHAALRLQHAEKRKNLKILEIIEKKIERDECKSAIKKLYNLNRNKGDNKLSSAETDDIRKKVCRCILQGESFPDGIWGIGNELKEIKSSPSRFGLSSKDYLDPVSNIVNSKGKTLNYPDGSTYSGETDNDLPNGNGVRQYSDGTKYEGNFAGGYFHGFGKISMADGTVREGVWFKNELNGRGKETFKDGTTFEGSFIDDERQLKGVYKYGSGDIYEGDFLDGKFDGNGKLTFKTGGFYEGEWLNDQRDGKGKYVYADGKEYEGAFLSDKFNGRGRLKLKEGDLYEADFENNEITGNCTIKRQNGDNYEGTYISKTDIGVGTIKYKNGEKYIGKWSNLNRDGEGKFISNDGFVYEGNWRKNLKDGIFLKYGIDNYSNRVELTYNNDIPESNNIKIWENNQLYFAGDPNGYATITRNGTTYQGYVINYVPNGQGKSTNENGDIIEANFINSKPDGNIKVIYKNGSVFEGIAKNGVIDGPATFTNPDGSYEKGEYKNNAFVKNDMYFNSKNTSQDKNTLSSNGEPIKFKYISNTTNECKGCRKKYKCKKKSDTSLELEKQMMSAFLSNSDFNLLSTIVDVYSSGVIFSQDEKKIAELTERQKGIYRINLYDCPDYCSSICDNNAKGYSSGGTAQKNNSNSPAYENCIYCNQLFDFYVWGTWGPNKVQDTKPGWIKCSSCRGYGVNEEYSHDAGGVVATKCSYLGCVNGWKECPRYCKLGKIQVR